MIVHYIVDVILIGTYCAQCAAALVSVTRMERTAIIKYVEIRTP